MAFDTNKTRTVLVVDDDEFVQKIVARQFEELGARVVPAGNGADAREALRNRGPFDLVVCDLRMPDVDGVEVLRDFAALQPSAALALMSSVDARTLEAAELLARTRELLFLGSLRKPVGPGVFKDLLERLEQVRALAPVPTAGGTLRAAPIMAVEELQHAITSGEIDVYVQPKVDLATGAVVGAEALARWVRTDGSTIPPGAFIDQAERWGLMNDLTDVVLRQAFSGCAHWRDAGLRLGIAVNVSASSLGRLDLPERIGLEAARFGLDPEQVTIEITETTLMSDMARLLDVVTRLRLRGFQLSVDDFGTGYSSLERLKRLPFTELKVDRAFVHGCARDTKLRSIVDSTLRLARGLRLSACAEGAESAEDIAAVRELGCELVQGYFVAKPMPKRDLPAWAAAHSARGAVLLDPGA